MWWPTADIGREAQERRIQPWCPGSAPLRSSWAAKPSPPGSSRSLLSLLLLLGLHLQSLSPPDKPAAPAGGAEPGGEGSFGKEVGEGGGAALRQREAPIHAPALSKQGGSSRKGWTRRHAAGAKFGRSSWRYKDAP